MEIKYLADVPEAVPVVARWLFDEWGQYREGNSLEKVRGRLELSLNPSTLPHILIATNENNIPLGTASLRYSDGIKQKRNLHPWLASVYVPKEHRKKVLAQT